MKEDQIKLMILDLIGRIDYDIAKEYDPELAEEPEYVEEKLNNLVKIVKKYLKK